MRLALLVDYANLFHSVRGDTSWTGDANEGAVQALDRLLRYLAGHETRCLRGGADWVARLAVVLDEPRFGPAFGPLERIGLEIERVALRRKSSQERRQRSSADDDGQLMEAAARLLPATDALVLVSNDGDYLSLAERVRHQGRLFVVAAYEAADVRLAGALRRAADEVIPLRDILLDAADPAPVPAGDADEAVMGPAVEVYRAGRLLASFPLDRDEVEIGRRSIRLPHFPHVDLTDHDPEKIVSRKHLCVARASGGRFVLRVNRECSRPTWLAGRLLAPGESVPLADGDAVVLGDRRGFGLLLRLPPGGKETPPCSSS